MCSSSECLLGATYLPEDVKPTHVVKRENSGNEHYDVTKLNYKGDDEQ